MLTVIWCISLEVRDQSLIMRIGATTLQKIPTHLEGAGHKFYPILKGGEGAQTISDPLFSNFVALPSSS